MRTTASPYSKGEEDAGKHSGRETSTCKTCGSDIYKVKDGSPDKYAWQHDITAGAGIPHQAYPVDAPDQAQESEKGIDVEAAGPRRFFAEHPSGYRAEYDGGGRYHVYDADGSAVDSPGFPWYTMGETSDELAEKSKKVNSGTLKRHLDSWVRRNGDAYTRFNHPEVERMSYGDRQRFKELDRKAPLDSFEAKAKKPIKDMSDDELAEHRAKEAKGDAWNEKHKVSTRHITAHWRVATDDEKKSGMSWYEDAHHMAKHIANDTGTDMHTMAGLISNYSPQTHWAENIMTSAKVARTKKPIGGKGSGVLATENQKKAAGRLLNGEPHEKVLAGPKTKAFAHLIEHGGNQDDDHPAVVIDRHALSVAAGARASDMDYARSKLGTKARYEEVSQAYHRAAKRISKEVGYHVSAHQVQAVTWLVRQRLNEEQDRSKSATSSSNSTSNAQVALKKWNDYAGEHHPGLMGKIPGTGYSAPEDVKHAADMAEENKTVHHTASWKELLMEHTAYGDVKAPNDVDTLRESECPVCGNDDSWDGDRCQVCGFFRPPKMFMDPDTSVAGQVDLRQDNAEQNGLPDPAMNQNGDQVGAAPGQANSGGGMTLDPIDQSQITEDGLVGGQDPNDPNAQGGAIGIPGTNPMDQADPNGIAAADAQAAGNAALVPGDLDANGQPIPQVDSNGQPIDPGAANKHFQQGGEPFTPGPNAPNPEEPMNPQALDEDGNPQNMLPGTDTGEDGQQPAMPDGEPGTPDDGVPDLICPACGFQADGGQPNSQGDSAMDPQVASPGAVEGDACPQCGQAAMESITSLMV